MVLLEMSRALKKSMIYLSWVLVIFFSAEKPHSKLNKHVNFSPKNSFSRFMFKLQRTYDPFVLSQD